ncbi:hypothetical protein RUND412_009066 [Rhizina undulata]
MPNKKSRAKKSQSLDYELAPTELAKTTNLSSTKSRLHAKRARKGKTTFANEDDTPKAFARLMMWTSGAKKYPNGLDDGKVPKSTAKTKKRKREDTAKANGGQQEGSKAEKGKRIKDDLKIQPNESLAAFNRRVDATLPVKMNRGHERKPKAPKPSQQKPGEGDDDYEDYDEEGGRKRKRGKNKGRATSPDPWTVLIAKREAPKFGDVVQAPPSLIKPRAVLHTRGLADVEDIPKAAGSLAKREGLALERKSFVEGYRKLMEGKREGDAV